MGSGPLDHPRLLAIEEHLDRAEIEAAQRLLAELGDLQVHRGAITYFATRLLYQRGRLDVAGVVERLRELMIIEPVFPQASAMLSAAERGTLRPDREGFQRATMSPLDSAPLSNVPSSPPSLWSEPPHKESSAPTIELGLDDLDTEHDQLSGEISWPPELRSAKEPAKAAGEPRRSLSMPQIPRAPMLPRFTPPANLAPSYAPGARSASAEFEIELELPELPRDTIQSEPEPGSGPVSSERIPLASSPASSQSAELSARVHGPESMLARARSLWEQGVRDRALAHVERLEHAPLLDPELRAECARFLIETGKPERALVQARHAVQDDPGSVLTQLMLVWSLVRAARRAPNQQAIEEAERVLARLRTKKGPLPALMQALRASVLAEKGDPDRAVTTAKLALKLDSGAADAEAALSLACARLGRLEDAQAAWQRLRELSPDEAERLSDRLQQLGVALRDVEAVPSQANSAVRLWDKVEVDLFSGEHESAIAAFERGAARELSGLVGESATDAIPLLATMAAGFFTTEPVWRHFAPYDLSLGSILRVEAVLDVTYGRKPRAALTSDAYPAQVMLATYVGECLRQGFGGSWVGSLAFPEAVFVDSEHSRFAPFHELRLRLEQGKPLLFDGAQSRRARASGAPISMPMAPPTPWDPAEWPSPRMLPRLGLALAQSVVELYCAEFGGGPLDRSLSGLHALDSYVTLLTPNGGKSPAGARWVKRVSVLVGAYLGETLREVLGAAWRDTLGTASGPESYALLLPDGGVTHPVQQAYERLCGNSASSLHEYATRLVEELG